MGPRQFAELLKSGMQNVVADRTTPRSSRSGRFKLGSSRSCSQTLACTSDHDSPPWRPWGRVASEPPNSSRASRASQHETARAVDRTHPVGVRDLLRGRSCRGIPVGESDDHLRADVTTRPPTHTPTAADALCPRCGTLLVGRKSTLGGPIGATNTKDLSWHFEQQRRFLFDLRDSPEEKASMDQHHAWNMKVIAQQEEITRLQARVRQLEKQNEGLHKNMSSAVHEREEWKSGALRMQLNREFKDTMTAIENDSRRFLKPTCGRAIPDFGQALQQQMRLYDTPPGGTGYDPGHRDHMPPPALRTFARTPGLAI